MNKNECSECKFRLKNKLSGPCFKHRKANPTPQQSALGFDELVARVALDVSSVILSDPPMRQSKQSAAIHRIINNLKVAHNTDANAQTIATLERLKEKRHISWSNPNPEKRSIVYVTDIDNEIKRIKEGK